MLLASPALAQQAPPAREEPRKSLTIRHAEAKVKVDGKLDEPVWRTLTPVTDFTQTDPDLGAPVSERTEAYIFYDSRAIYFGFKCYDREPKKIIHRYGAHDGYTGSDSVDILLDTFHDRRTGFYFSINSRGIQFDAISNEGNIATQGEGFGSVHDQTWDGIWQSAASLEPWGWSAEVVIPFRSIRVSHAPSQAWGINMNRSIVRRNEVASWIGVSRFDQTMKPSKSGDLLGLEHIEVGRNLELIPYFTTRYHRSPWLPAQDGGHLNAGLDARYVLAGNLTASLAVNPDFADTEADEFQPQLSRFELFFPEKRKFFTEGANYFQTPLDLLFTRRIGARLASGEPQRILFGGKLTGRIDDWTVGGLASVTERTPFTDPDTGARELSPAAFFTALRLQHNLFQKSAFGFLAVVRRQGNGTLGQSEQSYAADLSLVKGAHLNWSSQVAANLNDANPGFDAQHMAWTSTFRYNSELWEGAAQAKFLGKRLDVSSTGFEPATGRYLSTIYATYKPFLNRWGVRQLFLTANWDNQNNVDGPREDSGLDLVVKAQFANFWTFQVSHNQDHIRFFRFTPAFGRLTDQDWYANPKFRFLLTSNPNRALSFTLRYTNGKTVQFNENFHATIRQWEATSNLRLNQHTRLELNGTHIHEELPGGAAFQDRRFLITRLSYQFTPKWRTRILAQYGDDKRHSELNFNSILAYDFTARSAFYFGYNRQRTYPQLKSDLGNELFVKLSYLFSF